MKMKETLKSRENSDTLAKLGVNKGCFLDDKKELEDQPDKYNRAVDAIWNIASIFYPLDRTGNTTLYVPSEKLLKTGSISSKAKERIRRRLARCENGSTADKNIIVINRVDSGFEISETYLKDGSKKSTKEVQVDYTVEESTCHLTRNDLGKINLTIEKRVTGYHVCVEGTAVTIPHTKTLYQDVKPTAADINRTLFLLIEGAFPNRCQ